MKDKVAVVTGASRGIGLEISRALGKEGCRLALVARSKEPLQNAAETIASLGADCVPLVADVSDQDQVKAAFRDVISQWGRVDFLVNNAAVNRDGLILRMKREDWSAVLDANLTGVFY